MNVFYFNARFVFEDQPYEERNQYGFLAAEDFIHAMKQMMLPKDLLSVKKSTKMP